jgi:carbon storage regulator CsrA
MLVLGRRIGESIVIDTGTDIITVTVTQVGRGQAKIGIAADSHVIIDRAEIRERKLSGNWTAKAPTGV